MTVTRAPGPLLVRDAAGSEPVDAGTVALTIVIPVLNEADRIGALVRELEWADEVIVVDGGSIDGTVAAARRAGARTLQVAHDTIAAQRNAGIVAARNRWILALDADERVSPELRDDLSRLVTADVAGTGRRAYRIRSRNYYLGREMRFGPWARDWKVRCFTSDVRYGAARVHERPVGVARLESLSGVILHTPYRDLAHHVHKIVKYAHWGAQDLNARGARVTAWQLCARPSWRFVRDYLVLSGWRDGARGFITAALSAFASFLKYAQLYLLRAHEDAAKRAR